MAPANAAPRSGKSKYTCSGVTGVCICSNCINIGVAKGIMTAIVPQEEPIAMEVIVEVIKKMQGSKGIMLLLTNNDAK